MRCLLWFGIILLVLTAIGSGIDLAHFRPATWRDKLTLVAGIGKRVALVALPVGFLFVIVLGILCMDCEICGLQH